MFINAEGISGIIEIENANLNSEGIITPSGSVFAQLNYENMVGVNINMLKIEYIQS